MTFPVPKDVRGVRDFELVKGTDEMLRTSMPIDDKTKPIALGEWLKMSGTGTAAKVVVADNLAAPALGAKPSWTKFVPGDYNSGQADALATSQADLLSGSFQAKTKLYDTGASYTPGSMLVVIYDAANDRGILAPLDPAGPPTARQLLAAVGKIIQVDAGRLWFESLL